MNNQFNKLRITDTSNHSDHSDEGYVESRFDEPSFMDKWTDDQKAGKYFITVLMYILCFQDAY